MLRLILCSSALLAAVSSAWAGEDVIIAADKVPYVVEAPDQPQRLGRFWGDRATGPAGTLLKVPGNWVAPVHAHTADYRAVVIDGIWKHWLSGAKEADAADLHPGSYWTQKADEPHDDACVAPEGCVILLINEMPYSTYLPKP